MMYVGSRLTCVKMWRKILITIRCSLLTAYAWKEEIWSGRMTYLERKDVEPLKARSHAQNLLSVICIIEVPFLRGVAHTSRIPSNNIEICTSINTSLSMPLHLSWPSIMHWRGEDRNDSWFWVEDTFLKNLVEINSVRMVQESELEHSLVNPSNHLFHYRKRHHSICTGVLSNCCTTI